MAHIEKFSFHQSGICRQAFTDQYGKPAGLDDRATQKWKRLPAEHQGLGRARRVLMVGVPTDFLSTGLEPPRKPVTWIRAAPAGKATYVELLFTREDALSIQWQFARQGLRVMVDFMPLPNGDNFVICAHHDKWDVRNVFVPSSHHENSDLMFSSHDPARTGRPTRLIIYNMSKDGEVLLGRELGGYPISRAQLASFPHSFDTLTRSQVFTHERGRKSK